MSENVSSAPQSGQYLGVSYSLFPHDGHDPMIKYSFSSRMNLTKGITFISLQEVQKQGLRSTVIYFAPLLIASDSLCCSYSVREDIIADKLQSDFPLPANISFSYPQAAHEPLIIVPIAFSSIVDYKKAVVRMSADMLHIHRELLFCYASALPYSGVSSPFDSIGQLYYIKSSSQVQQNHRKIFCSAAIDIGQSCVNTARRFCVYYRFKILAHTQIKDLLRAYRIIIS